MAKRKDTHTISSAAAPLGVIKGSRAEVSFIAGMLVDKFFTTFRSTASTGVWPMPASP